MTSLIKMAAAGALATIAIAVAAPAFAQVYTTGDPNRLCLRFDNKSLISDADEGQDAYDRAAALGNRCFANFYRLNAGVTILPFPNRDTEDDEYYFLSREQRRTLGIGNPP